MPLIYIPQLLTQKPLDIIRMVDYTKGIGVRVMKRLLLIVVLVMTGCVGGGYPYPASYYAPPANSNPNYAPKQPGRYYGARSVVQKRKLRLPAFWFQRRIRKYPDAVLFLRRLHVLPMRA